MFQSSSNFPHQIATKIAKEHAREIGGEKYVFLRNFRGNLVGKVAALEHESIRLLLNRRGNPWVFVDRILVPY